MQLLSLITLLAASGLATATADAATSNTKGKCPGKYACSATEVSDSIQAAECAMNTRTSAAQTFAVFVTNPKYNDVDGAPYGDCSAYTCTSPTADEMTDVDDECWTFFWSGEGADTGYGTSCIKSPSTGECGCENDEGVFIPGATDCSSSSSK